MEDPPVGEIESMVRRMRKMFDECGPGPGQYDRFFTKLHGPGWKERALANGPPQNEILYGGRLSELNGRVRRIERHLKLEPTGE